MSEDDKNVIDWIQGKAKLKAGLAFPPDFLKREFKPSVKTSDELTKAVEKAAEAKKVPVKQIKVAKIDPKDLKGLPKVAAEGPVIRILVDTYPHRAGTLAETKSNGFRDGMTVAEYKANDLGLKGYWHTSHLKWSVKEGLIKIEE